VCQGHRATAAARSVSAGGDDGGFAQIIEMQMSRIDEVEALIR
jgi:hypothetical protein